MFIATHFMQACDDNTSDSIICFCYLIIMLDAILSPNIQPNWKNLKQKFNRLLKDYRVVNVRLQ